MVIKNKYLTKNINFITTKKLINTGVKRFTTTIVQNVGQKIHISANVFLTRFVL